jgi:hypothetical protein
MPTTLNGCAKSLPPIDPPALVIPGDIKAEIERLVAPPVAGRPMSKGEAFALIAKLRASEVGKRAAGKRLIRLVEDYRAKLQAATKH